VEWLSQRNKSILSIYKEAMSILNNNTPLWQLTVGEFLELQKTEIELALVTKSKRYEYGLKGLAKILGCSRSTASKIKSSGILDEAICQNGKLIIIDKEKALELLKKSKE
jgi:hypothetical protein